MPLLLLSESLALVVLLPALLLAASVAVDAIEEISCDASLRSLAAGFAAEDEDDDEEARAGGDEASLRRAAGRSLSDSSAEGEAEERSSGGTPIELRTESKLPRLRLRGTSAELRPLPVLLLDSAIVLCCFALLSVDLLADADHEETESRALASVMTTSLVDSSAAAGAS